VSKGTGSVRTPLALSGLASRS